MLKPRKSAKKPRIAAPAKDSACGVVDPSRARFVWPSSSPITSASAAPATAARATISIAAPRVRMPGRPASPQRRHGSLPAGGDRVRPRAAPRSLTRQELRLRQPSASPGRSRLHSHPVGSSHRTRSPLPPPSDGERRRQHAQHRKENHQQQHHHLGDVPRVVLILVRIPVVVPCLGLRTARRPPSGGGPTAGGPSRSRTALARPGRRTRTRPERQGSAARRSAPRSRRADSNLTAAGHS